MTAENSDAQTVTVDDLRALLDAGDDSAALVLSEGRVQVADAETGLALVDRGELRRRLGADPDDTALREQAALLTTELGLQGA